MIFNYYPADIKQSIPIGNISLERFINVIKNPKKQTKYIFEQIKVAQEKGNMALKQQLKTKLYYFTPCVFVEGRRKYENIKNFTGILALDFDKIHNAIDLKEHIFLSNDFIIAAWLSPSKHGVRALVSIPICKNVEEFKEYYNAIEQRFGQYIGFDKAVKNCILPMFLSYDENILYREIYSTWTKKIIIAPQPIIKQYIITDKTKLIEAIIKSSIDKIVDNGHPQLRAAAFVLGGYIGGGYIDKQTASIIIENLINTNNYLSQKSPVYIKTANEMIEKGISKPLYINE